MKDSRGPGAQDSSDTKRVKQLLCMVQSVNWILESWNLSLNQLGEEPKTGS
jgi:hypothetical protein